MVRVDLRGRDITDEAVLTAMGAVPRECFVPDWLEGRAYTDRPLPIGSDQTISQPYIVALMTQAAQVGPGAKVLEIGTGSGYQAAVLAAMGCDVYTSEIVPELAQTAAAHLRDAGLSVHQRTADGYGGWADEAPFDAILLTAAPYEIPAPLLEQLAVGGRLVAPVGPDGLQQLVRVTRTEQGFETEELLAVRFVPMTGRARAN